ncbi:24650_t:CDS:2 [Gigaspora rosea]|nr:24650_t:CDS:2 [Gigaspora rosea]
MAESISLLTNIIFKREIIGNNPPIVTFSQLKLVAEDKNDQLGFFFNEIEAMACLERKNKAERRALEWSLAYQCYLMCWNQCMAIPLWNLKDEPTANNDNLSWKKNEQELVIYSFKQLRREMVVKDFRLSNFFDSIYNASLPEKRSDKSLNKLDKKLAVECYIICGNQNSKLTAFKKNSSLFVDFMGVSMEAIDALLYADSHYMRRMSKTFNDQFYYETPLDEKLENMTLHKYDDRIQEQREERKMKDTILLDFFELSLKEIDQYIDALQHVCNVSSLTNYLNNYVIPVVADWPEQVFTRQAITLHLLNRKDNIPNSILSFIPIIGVLYIQLNILESIIKIYWDFFNMEHQYVFSTTKIVDVRKTINSFEDIFAIQKKSTYADKDYLTLLTKKAQVFLLKIFGNAYQRLGQSFIVKGPGEIISFKLTSLNITVDKKQMPLGFSSTHLPLYNKCDHCYDILCDGTGKSSMVIACGHGYHESCFTISLNGKCYHCENVLKLGIQTNVSSLVSRLSKLNKSKSNLKNIIEADEDSPQDQQIVNEDDILEVLRKDKQALPRVEQAYSIALERFLNTNTTII